MVIARVTSIRTGKVSDFEMPSREHGARVMHLLMEKGTSANDVVPALIRGDSVTMSNHVFEIIDD